ncbi:MAG: sugar phosphate isomerase/epimerase [Opitutus sp.]|nr:sugar phosphate isomerase/epimerase [Opitutus sp.]
MFRGFPFPALASGRPDFTVDAFTLIMNSPSLVRFALIAVACLALPLARAASKAKDAPGPKLGLQTWTCRNMEFDQVVEFATKHGITQLEFISKHLDPKGTREETLRKKAILEQKGLTAYSFGVNATSMDKAENRKLFEFAKLMGMKVIVVEPKNLAEWDNLEELVKEYDLKLAIHNHGTGSVYGDPATVKKVLAARDQRIGVCLDIGWVTSAGFDAAAVYRDYGDRVYDMHFKDKVTETDAAGKVTPVDTEIGKGNANYAGLFAEIKKSKWSGVMAIETDSKAFAEDPNRLVVEARKFFAASAGKK